LRAIEESADPAFSGDVERLLVKEPSGDYKEKNADVRRAASSAKSAIELRALWFGLIGHLFYGLSLGSVLLLAALGLAITFGLMRVINMAHGELLMLGAYATYVVQQVFQTYLPDYVNWYLMVAIPVAFVVTAAIGMALERTILRYFYGRPLETLLCTWGISLILIQTVRLIFGAQNVTVANPSWLAGGVQLLPGFVLTYSRVAVIAFSAVVVAFVWFMLQRTPLGLHVRAVTQNRAMAASMGISTRKVDMFTFGIGSGVAGLGGVALSQLGNVGPELGQGYIVDSFMVVVLGGVGKLAGTLAGAFGLGIVNKLLEPVAGAVLGKIAILAFIILFIQRRPQGIFALKGRAAEVS
jgi:urea transport system permease protein